MKMNSHLFQADSVSIFLRVPNVMLIITSDKLLRNSIENTYFSIISYEISFHFLSEVISYDVNGYL